MKMENIVEKKLGCYGWYHTCKYICDLPIPPRPPYMRYAEYERLATELKEMQKTYLAACVRSLTTFQKKYGL